MAQEQPTTEQLIEDLQEKNRKFKLAAIACMGLMLTGLVVLVLIGLSTLGRVNSQLEQQKLLLARQDKTLSAISATAGQSTQQISSISKQLDCIAQFFTQRNRTNVVITDLEQCKILNPDGTVTQGSGFNATPRAAGTPGAQGSQGATGNAGSNTTPSQPAQQPAQPEPVRVLGVPVCVPLTGVCVR